MSCGWNGEWWRPITFSWTIFAGWGADQVLRDRGRLSEAGVVTVTVVINAESGELIFDPSIVSWGLVDNPVAVLDVATDEVVELVSARMEDGLTDLGQLRAVVRRAVARVVRDETRQRPVVLVEVVAV